ncbi:2-octaprenyl-6-methoxyphenyl hydroxylase [Endozoicomonas sp. G2_2]|uniref:2-octaprenyl-6-methoxyphenyl hydroxylase n=1 Tax=Endozoicomonas sp. G2_2 TaxID=2821092 RepID=UPI001ADCBC79|nr:2-octaprenyl-6-methoxyphenyl hydroxylase [Endozoicomonas sp. G2_2]
MSRDYDIAVVGGGLAGASLACALADTGLSIALVEAVPFDTPADANMQARTTALAWGTRALFEQLGLWGDMARDAAPIKRLHVSQQGRFGTVRVNAADYDLPALGYVLPNLTMIEALRARLAAMPQVDVVAPARFESLVRDETNGHIEIRCTRETGASETLRTRLLVGADGARSSVRGALGIGARTDDYHQRAIITIVEPERAHGGCAYERFTPDGPIALLPRTRASCAAVWTLPSECAEQLCAASDDDFIAEMQAVFGERLGALALAGPRGSYPLARVLCERAAVERAVLIGNAGHALHPAAAQGFNLAIRDALVLAAMLRERLATDSEFDPGSADLLNGWAEARRPDQHRVANFTDAIVRLFSNRIPGLDHARGAGLFGLSLLPALRDDMARRSMGLAVAPAGPSSNAHEGST